MSDDKFGFEFDNSFAREMEGFYAPVTGAKAPTPKIVLFNDELAAQLGLNADELNSTAGAAILSGSVPPTGASPLAQAYAGHQFGGFSPQLGDGRAMLLGEILDKQGLRVDVQLKGSGPTPFSRNGDGKAALGPVLREYIIGEAMHGLGIPTTRALAALTTGEDIRRDGFEPGAVLSRIAASHLRVGSFQYFAARKETEQVRQLADYAIARHYPDLENAPDKYLAFLANMIDNQVKLVAQWVLVGFVHGVMNTDNMTISGETIDYGPCAFMEAYDPKTLFSSIDQNGRYAYGNQPVMAQWNLARFAETLLAIIDPDLDIAVGKATALINEIPELYTKHWLAGMRTKIGLTMDNSADVELVNAMLKTLEGNNVDYTMFFRHLSLAVLGDDDAVLALFADSHGISDWLVLWRKRLESEADLAEERSAKMNRINPLYVARNHLVEAGLSAAQSGDYAPIHRLLEAVKSPFEKRDEFEDLATPAPNDFGPYQTFCGT